MTAAAQDAPGPPTVRGEGRDVFGARSRGLRRLLGGLDRSNRLALAAAALVTLAAWAIGYHSVKWDHEQRLTQHAQRATELVSVFEGNTLKILGYADTYLQEARRLYQQTGSLDAVRDFVARVPYDRTILSHITVVDAAGAPIYISGHEVRPGTTAADRPYFLFQKATQGDQTYLSLPLRGRNTGRLTMRLVRRIEGPGGQFDGVIFAAIEVDQITAFFSALNLGRNSSATLVGLDKKIRARSSYGQLGPGQDISGSVLWDNLASAPQGLYRQTSVVDGVSRFYAYRKLDAYPLIAAIGVAIDDVLQDSRHFALSVYTITTLVTLVILLLTSSILRDSAMLRKLRREIGVRRRAEAEAVRANEVKSTFLATMSHEVRTPVNAIMGLFELIEAADVPDRQKRQARAGHAAAGELLKQLTNALDASRLEAKSLTVTLRPEPVAQIAANLRHLLEAAISRACKPIETCMQLDAGVPEFAVLDRRRVDQIVINLIDNAVKFTAAGRICLRVDVATLRGAPALRIAVSDTGSGVPPGDLDRIFDRFVQIDGAMTRSAGGAGLGLSICRELAALMQGELTVDSTPGEGSTFTLLLPLRPARAPSDKENGNVPA